jgi:hypothetical protein
MAFGERMNRPANPQCVVSARADDGPCATGHTGNSVGA